MSGVRKFLALRRESEPSARVPKAMTLLFPDEYLDQPVAEHDTRDESDANLAYRELIGEMFLRMHEDEPATPPHGQEAQTKAAVSHQLDEKELAQLKAAPFPKLIVHGEADELIKPGKMLILFF